MNEPTSRNELIDLVRETFSGFGASREPVRGVSDEARGIARVLAGRAWQEVDIHELSSAEAFTAQDLPAFLSDEGVAAYMPILVEMATDLGGPRDIADQWALTLRSRPVEIAEHLDRQQLDAVLRALEWLASELASHGVEDSEAHRTLNEIGPSEPSPKSMEFDLETSTQTEKGSSRAVQQ